MERRLKERLIGAAVLVMLAVIFIPMILDDSTETDVTITESNIPARPGGNFNSRIVPLTESELTPIVEEAPEDVEVEEITQDSRDEPTPLAAESPTIAPAEPVYTAATPAPNAQMGATAWVVQLGSFSSEENAKGLNEKLRKAGYPSFIEPLKKNKGFAYRVRVGPELLRSDAQSLQAKLKENMQIEGIVIRYP